METPYSKVPKKPALEEKVYTIWFGLVTALATQDVEKVSLWLETKDESMVDSIFQEAALNGIKLPRIPQPRFLKSSCLTRFYRESLLSLIDESDISFGLQKMLRSAAQNTLAFPAVEPKFKNRKMKYYGNTLRSHRV